MGKFSHIKTLFNREYKKRELLLLIVIIFGLSSCASAVYNVKKYKVYFAYEMWSGKEVRSSAQANESAVAISELINGYQAVDISNCSGLLYQKERDVCFSAYAKKVGDKDFCYLAKNSDIKLSCLQMFSNNKLLPLMQGVRSLKFYAMVKYTLGFIYRYVFPFALIVYLFFGILDLSRKIIKAGAGGFKATYKIAFFVCLSLLPVFLVYVFLHSLFDSSRFVPVIFVLLGGAVYSSAVFFCFRKWQKTSISENVKIICLSGAIIFLLYIAYTYIIKIAFSVYEAILFGGFFRLF